MTEAAKKPSTRKEVDWDLVEVDYRSGVKTLRQIADENGITHGAVNKRAKVRGWTRDLSAKIKAKADEKVSKAAVSSQVSTERLVTEQAVVEANAEMQTNIRLSHRADIGRTRKLFRALLEEVEVASTADGRQLIADLIEVMHPEGENDDSIDSSVRAERMRKLFERVTATTSRIDNTKKLTEILEKLVRIEREAFGIDDKSTGDGAVEEMLRALGRG